MRPIVSMALAAGLLFAAAPAAAENWRPMTPPQPEVEVWIDMDSIRVAGRLVHFRVKIAQAGMPGYGIAENTADCRAGTGETNSISIYDGRGQLLNRDDFAQPETITFNESDEELVSIVCR